MLEKPDIPEEEILSSLRDEYGLLTTELTFLPLGADAGTAVYRVTSDRGKAYFLKLRKGFEEITVTVPLFLKSRGIETIVVPIQTDSKQYWADFGEYKMILYPFMEGKDGFERELTDHHRRILGSALRRIHTAILPPDLQRLIPKETFSSQWRERLKTFQVQVESHSYQDSIARKLAEYMRSKQAAINYLLARTEQLVSELQSQPLEFVLCHTDIHGGNILIRPDGQVPVLYIVDWDNPLLAPKERDLMFVGGGIDTIWKSKREEDVFYEGYSRVEINLYALAYYRFERIIEDLAAFCEQLLLTDAGGADREQAYQWFTSNFEPGKTIEIAEKTDGSLP